ncbi:MAG: apolipoprotein N-acyltransferase [Candidatus Omnitrophica bacterium]|nr:apolipoprotein N-acyltransferase [Candidatus Omnitrophota bacterium]
MRLRETILIGLSAVLLVLPFHFGELGFLAFFAFIPYFFAVRQKSSRQVFGISFLFGFFYYLMLGFWLGYVNVLGVFLAAACLSLYFAAFGLFYARWGGRRFGILWAAPAFWVVLEYVRSWLLTGLPWALLAYSQWKNPLLIQMADVTGAYGVSYFVLLVNVVLFEMFLKKSARGRLLAVLAVSFFVVLLYGGWRWGRWSGNGRGGEGNVLRVSVVQGNIPQEQKWDARIKNIIFEKYRRLTLMGALDKPDLIVWPETSFPGYLEDEPLLAAGLRNLARQAGSHLLVGAPTLGMKKGGLHFYNSAVLIGPDGEERRRYDKLHLVPFGEYVPMGPFLSWIRYFVHIGRFSAGGEHTVFTVPSGEALGKAPVKFAAVICFEDIFPSLARRFRREGADFLINMTNDAWFGKTTAPYQHAQASIFRAVENRMPVVRAANTGLSCFISPRGEVTASVEEKGEEIFVSGHRTADLSLFPWGFSFYTRFGDVFVGLCGALCLFLCWKR